MSSIILRKNAQGLIGVIKPITYAYFHKTFPGALNSKYRYEIRFWGPKGQTKVQCPMKGQGLDPGFELLLRSVFWF
jgi:hypothetical protein